jgi:hypothetical protein
MPGAEFWGPLEVSARYPQWLKLQRRQCPLIGRVCELWERLEEVQDYAQRERRRTLADGEFRSQEEAAIKVARLPRNCILL